MNDRIYHFSPAGVLVLCGLGWIVFSHFEAQTFGRLTGREVSTGEAMFIQLRVIEPIDEDSATVEKSSSLSFRFRLEGGTKRMYQIKRTDEEINEVWNKATDALDSGSRYPGMSFEEGIAQFAAWLFGHSDDEIFE